MEFYFTVACDQIRPYMPIGVSYMLPASSWSRIKMKPPKLPIGITQIAADCGGFVATKVWGDYRYTADEYTKWLHSFNPQWAATMDYCCEDEITTGNTGIIRKRQDKTTEQAYHFWHTFRSVDWQWVPTIQGWSISDYVYHARQMKPLIYEMKAHYGDEWRVGIGTLCNRASAKMCASVVNAVSRELPEVKFHLWGVKLSVLKNIDLPQVKSVDSAAWVPGGLGKTGHEAREEQLAMGLTQREHMYQIALPRYLEKVNKAIDAPKKSLQLMLI